MAKAEKTTIIETRPVEVEAVRLTLSAEEARVLKLVTGSIGGNNKRGSIVADIYEALLAAGVENIISYDTFDMRGHWPMLKGGPV